MLKYLFCLVKVKYNVHSSKMAPCSSIWSLEMFCLDNGYILTMAANNGRGTLKLRGLSLTAIHENPVLRHGVLQS